MKTLRDHILILFLLCLYATIFSSQMFGGELHSGNYDYIGGVKGGKQNGYGVCRYKNGNVYYGFWDMGYKSGLGRMVFSDGRMDFGVWRKGTLANDPKRKFHVGERCYGIDVSKYQKKVDWERLSLSANASGAVIANGKKAPFRQPVLFALIKSTQSTTIRDPQFERNWKECKRCGIIRGAYHFLSVSTPVEEQVKYFIANTPLEPGDLPPVLDLEIDKKVMQKQHSKVIKMAKRWLELIEAHYGVRPIIYTYNNYYIDYMRGHGLDDYDYWIARYGKEPSARHWEIWQFTETGVCKGINHAVDIDLFRGSYNEMLRYVKQKGIRRRK